MLAGHEIRHGGLRFMHRCQLLLVLILALVMAPLHADELGLVPSTLGTDSTSCGVKAPRRRLAAIDENSIDMRPPDEKVTKVEVGIIIRKLYGIQVKLGTYSADVVITLRWKDKRVAEMVPGELTHLALSAEAAKKSVWVPDVIPTNRDIEGLEEISSATIIWKEGKVERTKRFMVRMRQQYQVSAYPFDQQTLQVIVASSKYMFDEVVLVEIKDHEYNGPSEGVMGTQPWDLMEWWPHVIEETAGSLRKSRCVISLRIRRKSRTITESTIIPELLLLTLAWTVFFFPMVIQYVVPRVATCLVLFLTMAQFSSKTAAMLPDTGDLTWITVWEQCCTFLMFEASVFNAFTEIVYHKLEYKEIAERLRFEMALCFAGLAFLFIILTRIYCYQDGYGLGFMCLLARFLIATTILFWFGRGVIQCLAEYRRRNQPSLAEQDVANIEMSERSIKGPPGSSNWW